MNNKNFSGNGPKSPIKRAITNVISNGNVAGYVPLQDERCFDNNLVLFLPAKKSQIILVKVTLRIYSDNQKSSIVFKELGTNVEMVAKIQRLEDIPPKPPNETVELLGINYETTIETHSQYYTIKY